MNKSLLKRMGRCFVALLIFFAVPPLVSGSLFAQQISVSGVVKDSKTGAPLGGVAVTVIGTNAGEFTKDDGSYTIKAPSSASRLSFYLVGYAEATATVGTQTTINASLVPEATQLDELVFIGYESQKKRKVTASISSIDADKLKDLPSPNIENLLQGRIAGVNIQNITGETGVAPTMVVRGNSNVSSSTDGYSPNILSQPLYVIDGIIVPNDNLGSSYNYGTGTSVIAGINVNDIETIDVLKDASAAAIYGSRGANGVVIIKTKRGATGKPKIKLSAMMGVQFHPQGQPLIGGAKERRYKISELYYWAGNTPGLGGSVYDRIKSIDAIQALNDSLNPYYNNSNDWQGIYFETGFTQQYNLSVTGGTEQASYRLGFGYYDEKGTVIGTGYSRYTFTDAQDFRFGDKLQLMTTISYGHSNRSRGSGQYPGRIFGGSFSNLRNLPASFYYISDDDIKTRRDQFGRTDNNIDNNFNGNATFIYSPVSIVRINLSMSAYYNNSFRRQFSSSTITNDNKSWASSYYSNSRGYSFEPYISVSPSFGDHNFAFLFGGSIDETRHDEIYSYGHGAPNDAIQLVTAATIKDDLSSYTDYVTTAMTSIWGRLSYDYKGKYLVSGTLRADASSKFMPDNQWGYFPSVSAGWIVTDEAFMQPTSKWLNMWKIRGSYGLTGQQIIDNPYLRYSVWDVDAYLAPGSYIGSLGNATYGGVTSLIPAYGTAIPQKDLSWQKVYQFDLGMDIGLFNENLWFEIDYYNKNSKGNPWDVPLPIYYGFQSAKTNAIDVNNRGIDFLVRAQIFKETQVKWESTLNFGYNLNTITKLPDSGRDIVISEFSRYSVGYATYPFYRAKTTGIFDYVDQIPVSPYTGVQFGLEGINTFWPGWFSLDDVNGDYLLTKNAGAGGDYQIIGNPNAKWNGGFSNTVQWKNLTLNVNCIFTFDRDIEDTSIGDRYYRPGDQVGGFVSGSVLSQPKNYFWRKPGDGGATSTTDTPSWSKAKVRMPLNSPYVTGYGSYIPEIGYMIQNGAYFKIKDATLNYHLPEAWMKKVKIPSARVYATITNIYTFKSSKVLCPDPELVDAMGKYQGTGYPLPRTLVFGLDIDF